MSTPVIAIFDIGKTNKKLFLFNEQYHKVYEESIQLKETVDEDGDVCEDLLMLTKWVEDSFVAIMNEKAFIIKAVNFSAYGASLVHIMKKGKELLPLYNYLKPYPNVLQESFYEDHGGKIKISKQTASPVSGSLNSGLQLYRIKKEKPDIYKDIKKSLHLPQYLSYLITNKVYSDITSIGCHTSLWNFESNNYHQWVLDEQIHLKLAPIKKGNVVEEINYNNSIIRVGVGLHDSSAALIPYLLNFPEPFILISTGTWCISLNPFDHTPLTEDELNKDCLCYIQYKGLPVKASRLFAGYWHEQQIKKMAVYFEKPLDYYKQISYNPNIIELSKKTTTTKEFKDDISAFAVADFKTYEEAYHQLMTNIINQQVASTSILLKDAPVKRIFVDGGFSKNILYMNFLAIAFPDKYVFATSMAQATAMGAALAIHDNWNTKLIPTDIIELKMYTIPKR